MPMPRWVAWVNKRVTNKAVLKRGASPVLRVVGRSSGGATRCRWMPMPSTMGTSSF